MVLTCAPVASCVMLTCARFAARWMLARILARLLALVLLHIWGLLALVLRHVSCYLRSCCFTCDAYVRLCCCTLHARSRPCSRFDAYTSLVRLLETDKRQVEPPVKKLSESDSHLFRFDFRPEAPGLVRCENTPAPHRHRSNRALVSRVSCDFLLIFLQRFGSAWRISPMYR